MAPAGSRADDVVRPRIGLAEHQGSAVTATSSARTAGTARGLAVEERLGHGGGAMEWPQGRDRRTDLTVRGEGPDRRGGRQWASDPVEEPASGRHVTEASGREARCLTKVAPRISDCDGLCRDGA
ncbi:hypothetical protein QFZ64_000284 [Streptomyces sp. B3I8]|jgi:hypothetical protein|nr:hypothetical protein [Streptomyces sp. B3I8]